MTSQVLMDTAAQARRRFIGNATDAVGRANTRLLWTPSPTEGLTQLDGGPVARTWTHATSPNGRVFPLGRGYGMTFNGTTDCLSTPDAADLTFIEPAPMSLFAVCNITDTAAVRTLFGKDNPTATQREYVWSVQAATDFMAFQTSDQSLAININRSSDAAITMGAWTTQAATYSGLGGATAMNGALLYQNGALFASTATNNASYVAMEDLGAVGGIGANNGMASNFFQGSLALILLVATTLSAGQVLQLNQLARSYFGVPF